MSHYIEYHVNPMSSSKLNVLFHNSIISGKIWKLPSQIGVFLYQMIILSTNISMLSWKLIMLSHVSVVSRYYLLNVYIKSHFLLFDVQLWQPWLTIWNLLFLCRLTDLLQRLKWYVIPTHYYWSFPFSSVNSPAFILTFSCVCQIYASGTI